MKDWLKREELLIGKENINKLNNAKVAIFGCGGVGSYVIEALSRAGVGNFVLVDNDIVDVTNINRQLVADITTVGKVKVDIAKEKILRINPEANVITYQKFYEESNSSELLKSDYTYVVDAIDSVQSKISLIKTCKELNIPIISAMGMGNKLNPTMIQVLDISKTEVCPLAKIIRKKLREIGINHLKVVYSKEPVTRFDTSEENKRTTATISFMPSVAGLIIASEVVKDIINKK